MSTGTALIIIAVYSVIAFRMFLFLPEEIEYVRTYRYRLTKRKIYSKLGSTIFLIVASIAMVVFAIVYLIQK